MLLAAGRGMRFGGDKRFASLPDGRGLLEACLDSVLAAELPLLVTLAAADDRALPLLDEREIPWVACDRAGEGMGGSLAQGAMQMPDWRGVLVALADMPWIAPRSFARVASQLTQGTICRPHYRGRPGHPVGFGKDFFGHLRQLEGDSGARKLLQQFPDALAPLALDDPGILRDVDLPGDLPR